MFNLIVDAYRYGDVLQPAIPPQEPLSYGVLGDYGNVTPRLREGLLCTLDLGVGGLEIGRIRRRVVVEDRLVRKVLDVEQCEPELLVGSKRQQERL